MRIPAKSVASRGTRTGESGIQKYRGRWLPLARHAEHSQRDRRKKSHNPILLLGTYTVAVTSAMIQWRNLISCNIAVAVGEEEKFYERHECGAPRVVRTLKFLF